MFFEKQHSVVDKEFLLSANKSLDFPLHIHKSFEVFFQHTGQTRITIDDKVYLLSSGQAVLIFPFQKHAYDSVQEGSLQLLLFSPDMALDFYNAKKTPTDNLFYFDDRVDLPEGYLLQKALVYSVLGVFDKGRKYIERQKSTDVLLQILLLTDSLYGTNCTLKEISNKLGYDYAYISKLFKKRVGVPFNNYINLLRVNDSKDLLANSNKSVTEIAEICGFNSLRTFNRVFLSFVGVSPNKFRQSLK